MDTKTQENAIAVVPKANTDIAFSKDLPDLSAALDLLYIRSNAGGRNNFRAKWPQIAEYIFGAQLIDYDNHGGVDQDMRIKLENEAGARRIALKQTLSEIKEKSIEDGSLQFSYVTEIINLYGEDISHFLYADEIIERICGKTQTKPELEPALAPKPVPKLFQRKPLPQIGKAPEPAIEKISYTKLFNSAASSN